MAKRVLMLLAVGLLCIGAEGKACAQIFATDGGWTIGVDYESDWGLFSLTDPYETEHMYQEWWWFGVRDDEWLFEVPLDVLELDASNPDPDQILLEYYDEYFGYLGVSYDLDASGNSASIYEELYFMPNDGFLTEFDEFDEIRLFEYTDFDLNDEAEDQWAEGDWYGIRQRDSTGIIVSQVVPISPIPDHFQIAEFDDILYDLWDDYPTTLSDDGSPFGPGDATFAFQWNFPLYPEPMGIGEGILIAKRKDIVITPEPTSLCLLGIGLLGFAGGGFLRRR